MGIFNSFDFIVTNVFHSDILPESNLLNELVTKLVSNENVALQIDSYKRTLLHWASGTCYVSFCQLLVTKNRDALQNRDIFGYTPFHLSCLFNNVEVIKYLYEMDPACIDIPNLHGDSPIHTVIKCCKTENVKKVINFFLQDFPEYVKKCNRLGMLPLHLVCKHHSDLKSVKFLFNAYPEAANIECFSFEKPINYAKKRYNNVDVTNFLESQNELYIQAKAQGDALGSIRFALGSDNVTVGVVKLLLQENPKTLELYDSDKNSVIHVACRLGKLDIINFLVQKCCCGISEMNSEGTLPIQLLLFYAECDRNSQDYIATVHLLLHEHPVANDVFLDMSI